MNTVTVLLPEGRLCKLYCYIITIQNETQSLVVGLFLLYTPKTTTKPHQQLDSSKNHKMSLIHAPAKFSRLAVLLLPF